MRAVLMVGHGSRDQEGNEQVRSFIKNMIPKMDPTLLVETCFLEFEAPTIHQGIETCVKKGATSVAVVPIMLLPAGHSKIHIPAAIDEAKETYPHVSFAYGRPIGIHEATFTILQQRLEELGENTAAPAKDTAVILLGRGGSDPDANSDLYKIARLLWEKLDYTLVEPAFMGVTDPLVAQAVERCLKLGAKKVIILPYFLFTGILINRLEKMVDDFTTQYPQHTFELANYFGFHPELETILFDRVAEVLQGEVKMNCDTCQYRIDAMEHIDHHHHHDHDHDHGHHHHHHHHHEEEEQKV
ncbi:cobalamin (vitamin B12) biosynthesis CbiX protein [Fictibacillus macauensis ZFHKF-1]|uniref:Cobalamin (Vitamin B12) biosynthesis CbiX protein n=1 Tax=Fictibacillus macauensis ZFHKF-1 TaxID=1196324 RepID=I8UI33_9BACL|nr:sirohydrochlorin chelatase [Fictibacillus macauensis]EIT86468.1 cobalamin (vitamin B12) biosynthesis CbiX protein [Fictibacillus macauensis ZFHKF-1]